MGCFPGKSTPEAGVETTQPSFETQPSVVEGDFKATITKKDKSDLFGMVIISHEKIFAKVTEVNQGGLVDEWNKNNINVSDQIKVGDIIVSVNGLNGSVEGMKVEMKHELSITFSVKKEGPRESIAEEPAGGPEPAIGQEPAAEPQEDGEGGEAVGGEEAVAHDDDDKAKEEAEPLASSEPTGEDRRAPEGTPTSSAKPSLNANANTTDCVDADLEPYTTPEKQETKVCGLNCGGPF
eukprot:TRINITY_DN5688_c0_g1_i3.p2 TRINITY_DN5688_c0_g1~~TRINITY_DN5688_c0_g1_i3.p2  ORF type:complete len:237 (+),score=52.94 TRINITY_DN5688_c0_g1_i3:97-807(+)